MFKGFLNSKYLWLRLTTFLKRKALPVDPVNLVDTNSSRLVKNVSQFPHENKRRPPKCSKYILPIFEQRLFFCLRAKPTYVSVQSVCVVLCSSWERKKNRQIVRPLFSFVPHLKLYRQILNILAKNFHFKASKCQKFYCKVISQLSSVILSVLKISGL